jgi:hypothetical protein
MTGVSAVIDAARGKFDAAALDLLLVTFSTCGTGDEGVGPDCAQALLAMSRIETLAKRMG